MYMNTKYVSRENGMRTENVKTFLLFSYIIQKS